MVGEGSVFGEEGQGGLLAVSCPKPQKEADFRRETCRLQLKAFGGRKEKEMH